MRVLLVDEPWTHTPWLAQALREAGCAVTAATPAAGRARYRVLGLPVHLLPDDPAQQANALTALAASGDHELILPVSERLLLLCAQLHQGRARLALPVARENLPLLADRRRMLAFVTAQGIDVPPQQTLPSADAVADAARAFGWPLVLRGCQGTSASQVRIVDNDAGARAAWGELAAVSDGLPFAQAFIPGRVVISSGLFRNGHPVRVMHSIPVERWPLPTSPSIMQRTFRDPALDALVTRLFAALDYTGLASLELMQRPDGGYTFIELNPRSWGSVAVARHFGTDFCALYAEQLAGRPAMANGHAFEFPPGVEVPAFPQYLKARVAHGGLADMLRHPLRWLRALREAPWSRPRLLLAFAGQVWKARRRRA